MSLGEVFEVRAQVMKTVPNFMKGVFRGGLKMSLEEILQGRARSDIVKEIRGWKFFFLLPRLLLFRPPRGGLVPKARLQERVSMFNAGDWVTLLETSLEASVTGTTARCRRRRGKQDTIQARAARALGLVHMGVLSNARQALEGILWHQEQSRRGRLGSEVVSPGNLALFCEPLFLAIHRSVSDLCGACSVVPREA